MITDFVDFNGKHYPPGDSGGFTGSLRTGSTKALMERNQSRRDDLESLAYTFMFIVNRDIVPWRWDNKLETILNKMLAFIGTDTSKIPAEFQKIHKFILEVQKLEFAEEPPYEKLRLLIQNLILPIND
jgi:hypothetical protein